MNVNWEAQLRIEGGALVLDAAIALFQSSSRQEFSREDVVSVLQNLQGSLQSPYAIPLSQPS